MSDRAPRGLRFRLREVTAQAHLDLEATMALPERCCGRASYRELLARMWGIHAALEAALATIDEGAFASRCDKAAWLAQDLIALGLSRDEVQALAWATALPAIETQADGFGVLYVLEGATLGGRTILPLVAARLGVTPTSGARFFAGHGADTGANWRAFVAALAAHGATPQAADRVERAAAATFRCFTEWMAETPAHAL